VIAEIPPIETPSEQQEKRLGAWAVGLVALGIAGCVLIGSAVTYLYG